MQRHVGVAQLKQRRIRLISDQVKITIIISLMLIIQVPVWAQSQEQKIQEFELQRQALDRVKLSQELDSAILLSEQGDYLLADQKFRMLLRSVKSVPSDLVFHFGKNSYQLANYKQSIDWLNKYIQLKGTNAQYSQEAVDWLRKAESEVLKQRQIASQQAEQVLSKNYNIDCGPSGKVTCPVCKGSTVIIRKGYIEDTYKTCPYCNKLGYLICEDYNLLLKGQLEPSDTNH